VNEPSPECLQGYEDKTARARGQPCPHPHARPTFVVSEGEDGALYDSPISQESTDPEEILTLLDRGVIQSGVNAGSGGQLAYIPASNL
jgi:hypothetical protein